MPGRKIEENANYVTNVAAYRADLVAADAVIPPVDDTIPSIHNESARLTLGPANEREMNTTFPINVSSSRIGATNALFVYAVMDGVGMNITLQLWRVLRSAGVITSILEDTPAAWVAVTQSTVFRALNLPAGEYKVSATGVFAGGTLNLAECHTE